MYKSLPWKEDITRADALRRAGTPAPLRGLDCFQLKNSKSGGESDIWVSRGGYEGGIGCTFCPLFHAWREGGKEMRGEGA